VQRAYVTAASDIAVGRGYTQQRPMALVSAQRRARASASKMRVETPMQVSAVIQFVATLAQSCGLGSWLQRRPTGRAIPVEPVVKQSCPRSRWLLLQRVSRRVPLDGSSVPSLSNVPRTSQRSLLRTESNVPLKGAS
jgi:hypothetical protein